MIVRFAYECSLCPGDGVIRGKRPGVDWPTPCPCRARRVFSQYQIARIIEESPQTIVRVDAMRASPRVAERIFFKLTSEFERLGSWRKPKPKARRR